MKALKPMTWDLFVEFLISQQRAFVFFFCVSFGVFAHESYQILKDEAYKIKNLMAKLVLALFVCTVIGSQVDNQKIYPFAIMLLAFVHRPAADWLFNEALPNVLKQVLEQLLKMLNNNNKKKP